MSSNFDVNSNSSLQSLQSSNNSRAFDFDGLEESLVDNDLNESIESLNDLNYDLRTESTLRDDTNDTTRGGQQRRQTRHSREQSFHRIRDALIRDSNNRSEEDLELIHNFLSLIVRQNVRQSQEEHEEEDNNHQKKGRNGGHSLINKDFQTRRLLAKHMVLAEIEARDTRVLTHGERLDAYCVVACGSLRHVMPVSSTGGVVSGHTHDVDDDDGDDSCVDCVDGSECLTTIEPKVRYLTVGDEFGASLDDRVVFGEIFTNEDFVWVLCVPHIVFDEICGEKSFKTVFDEKNEKIIEIRNQFTNELIRATKERLLDLLFSSEDNYHSFSDSFDDSNETQFISDFLLTFRLFWSQRRDSSVDCIQELMTKVVENLKNDKFVEKTLKIVLFWISNHFQDFNRKLLELLEMNLKSKIHKKLLYFTLSSKSRTRHVTITRSDRSSCLPFALIGGYECSTRLFISDVSDDSKDDISRGDRLLSINGVDCHVMEVARAIQLCRQSTHLSLQLKFDPNLFHMLLDGQISRNNCELKRISNTETEKKTNSLLQSTHSSFASLKPIQQLSSSQTSSTLSSNNNNWKQKVKQIVQNVTNVKNTQNIVNNNQISSTTSTTAHPLHSPINSSSNITELPEIIKIYYDSDYRFLPIHATTTARECIQLALIEFQLNSCLSSRDFALFEYKLLSTSSDDNTGSSCVSSATTAVKRLSDNYQNLVQNLSLNSRIVLKCVSNESKNQLNDSEITKEIQREVRINSLLTLNKEAIARELTSRDFELFCRIESQQFIYDLKVETKEEENNENKRKELKEFEFKTNSELFWTINRILSEETTEKRVKSIKYLIGVAQECLLLNNFNSLFAILSGLSHQTVQRLKQMWDRVPQKTIKKLDKLYKLMDPSKNFNNFRQQLRHCSPPIIPFFPLVKKDLSFIDLANHTFIQCEESKSFLINWEKMRLLGHKCREVQQMTTQSPNTTPTSPTTSGQSSTMSSNVAKEAFNQLKALNINSKETNYKQIWEKQRMRKRVQHFLDKSFSEIICDENLLFEKSLECEPQPQQQSSTAQSSDRQSSIRSSQLSTSSSVSSGPSSASNSHLTTGAIMPSPTPSSHSSSPSLSSNTTNSSDIPSSASSHRLRFGVRDDTGLRKLLALSDNCVSVSHNHSLHRPLSSHSSSHSTTTTTSTGAHHKSFNHNNSHSQNQMSFLAPPLLERVLPVPLHMSSTQSTAYKPLLPEESSSVTSLRRLEQIQQLSRFREQFLPIYGSVDQRQGVSSVVSSSQRPSLPSYDQTIQRMKKKFNKNEENIV